MKNPTLEKILKEVQATHEKKNRDYSNQVDPYSNFKYAGEVARPFPDGAHKAFAVLVGVKLARMAELLQEGREPSNESLDDSFRDDTTYSSIWWAFFRDSK